MPLVLQVAPEVAAALRSGTPVVALESTLIAHGLPWPMNLETARAAEQAVREDGAVPATIAVRMGASVWSRPPDTHATPLAVRYDCRPGPSAIMALCARWCSRSLLEEAEHELVELGGPLHARHVGGRGDRGLSRAGNLARQPV